MEASGLVIGAAGLASLFTTCLDCLDMIDAGQNFSRDLEIALAKLEAQRAILLVWGSTVGLDNGGRQFNEGLMGPDIQNTIDRLLRCIVSLFEDSKKFRKRYGLRTATPTRDVACSSEYASTGLEAYRSRVRLFQKQSSFTTKFRWAVYDKSKFTALIAELKDLIDQLRDLTSSIADFQTRQRQILAAEISSLSDTHDLDVLEEALREDDPELSDVASQRIVQLTEAGTNAGYLMLESESQYVTAYSGVCQYDMFDDDAISAVEPTSEPDMAVSEDGGPETEETKMQPLDALGVPTDGHPELVYGQQNNLLVIHEQNKAKLGIATAQMTRGDRWVRRRVKEVLDNNGNSLVTLGPEIDNFASLLAAVQGPSGTPYEGGVFFIRLTTPKDFPLNPPVCHFLTPVLHPNITWDGRLVLDILDAGYRGTFRGWHPIWSLGNLLQAILSILCDPDWFDAVSPEISRWYGENPYAFEAQSRILTQRYAQRTTPMDREYSDVYLETLGRLGILHPKIAARLQEDTASSRTKLASDGATESPKDDGEGEMLLFLALVTWFALLLGAHLVLVEPSFV